MHRLYIDFETYFDQTYSLKKLPTMQYVRDDRFKTLGAAIIEDDGPPMWVEPENIPAMLERHKNSRIIAHNAQFDGAILTQRYGLRPQKYFCTMFAARWLIANGFIDHQLGSSLKDLAPLVELEKGDLHEATESGALHEYALNDVLICYRLHKAAEDLIPDMEKDIIDLHVRMAVEPILDLDIDKLKFAAEKDRAMEPHFPLLRKESEFIKLLESVGVIPEYKITPKGNKKLAVSKTDDFLSRLLENNNPEVVELAEAKLMAHSSIERTRSQRFLDVGAPFPCPLLYYGAHTGRSSGVDKLNPQNLPKSGGLRSCLRAPAGYKLVVVDASQIEVRVLAYEAGQESLLQIFREKRDPYLAFASEYLYKLPESQISKDQRQIAKAAVLALGFGQSAKGFLAYCERFGIDMDLTTAARVVWVYREAYPRVCALWVKCGMESAGGKQRLLSGRLLTYPEIKDGTFRRPIIFSKTKSNTESKIWHGLATENRVQASARDVVFWQALQLADKYKIVSLVHDEAIMCVPEIVAERCLADALTAFSTCPPFTPGLPLAGEGAIMDFYGK